MCRCWMCNAVQFPQHLSPITCTQQAICNGDYLRPLRLEVWDWDRDGSHDLIGMISTSLQGLLQGQGHELALEVCLCSGSNLLVTYRGQPFHPPVVSTCRTGTASAQTTSQTQTPISGCSWGTVTLWRRSTTRTAWKQVLRL